MLCSFFFICRERSTIYCNWFPHLLSVFVHLQVPTMTASTPTKSWTLASHGFTGESLLASTTTDQLWLWLLLILTATASIEEQSQQS
nr:hypothetical protein SEVIR_1G116666v2 [Setaria viridis]